VTATEIKLGQIATVSGPVPGLFQRSADSMDAYAAYINSQGGIDGHRLVVVHKDDGYDCVSYTNALKSLASQVFAVVGTFSVEDGCGQSVLKANPNLADIEADIINPQLFAQPNAFSAISQPPGYITTGYLWIKGKYPADITHSAQLYPTTAAFDANAQEQTALSVGYQYAYRRGVGVTETNFTSDILRMKAEGVKIVDLLSDPFNVAATFEQEAAQQGFHPDVVISATAYDARFFSVIGNPADANNLIAPLYFPMYLGEDRATNPELNTYLTWLEKPRPGTKADLFGTTSWAAGVLFTQALQKTGASATQAGLVQAVTNIGSFSANGLLPASNPGTRAGPQCQVIVGVQNGKFARLDPPNSGFECNGKWLDIPLSKLG
jgi:ABC-type branched-subunit amino acid transport system substrate-binding protein